MGPYIAVYILTRAVLVLLDCRRNARDVAVVTRRNTQKQKKTLHLQAAQAWSQGESPDGWSARMQTWHPNSIGMNSSVSGMSVELAVSDAVSNARFGRYPGFCAALPPEAEMWTDQELDATHSGTRCKGSIRRLCFCQGVLWEQW